MKKYFILIIKLYVATLLIFVVQKPLFMIMNASYGSGLTAADWLAVVWHGLRLDIVATCYLMVVPLLLLGIGVWLHKATPRQLLMPWYVVMGVAMTLAFVADAVLYLSWGAKLDAFDIAYAANPKEVFANFTWWVIVLGVAALAALAASVVVLLRWLTPDSRPRLEPRWAMMPVIVLLLALNVLGMRGGVEESTANPGYAYFSSTPYLNHAALNPLFNIIHSMGKSENLAQEFQYFDDDQLQALTCGIFDSYADVEDTLLNNTRPNVMLIIWEGGGELMTGDPEVAPCFNRLKAEGVYFSSCYANNFRTDRGLVSILSGWPGLPTTSLMKMSSKCRKLPGLARSLKGVGYHTAFHYGGDINFTNMNGYLYDIGFDEVEGIDDLNPNIPYNSQTDKWGIHDEYVLSGQYCSYPDKPWFATYLTLSSHEPWTVPYHRLQRERDNAFAYTDSCIGAFVESLKQQPEWRNMLLVIVPDHGVARNGESLGDVAVAKIPMLWIGGAVAQPKVIDRLMNQSDLAATLLAQLGIGAEDFRFSRNVTSRQYRPSVVLHAFKNGMNLIDTAGYSKFDCVDGRVAPMGEEHRRDAEDQAKAILQLLYRQSGRL